jgi:hypothetical protein
MRYQHATVALSLALLLAPAVAQEKEDPPTSRPSGWSAYARGPFLTVSAAGPKAIRQAILPTNLGTLVGGAECQPLWQALRRRFRDLLEETKSDDAEEAWAALEKRLLGFGGRIELEWHFAPQLRPGNWVRYHVAGHLVLWSDGRTDMVALSKEVRRFIASLANDRPRTEEFEGGHVFEIFGGRNDDGVTIPKRYREDQEHLVVFFGSRVDEAVTDGLTRLAGSWPQRLGRATARSQALGDVLTARIDMQQVSALIDDEFRRNPEEGKFVRRFFGADTWDIVRCEVATVGPHLQIEATADFLPGDRGLFAALLPNLTTLPALVHRAPAGTADKPPAFAAAHVRMDKLFQTFLELIANLQFGRKKRTIDDLRAEMRKELGFDFEKDLLAHVDTEVLALAHLEEPEDAMDRDRRGPDGEGLCFVVGIKNDAAFAKTFHKLIAVRELRAVEPEKHAGVDVVPVRFVQGGEYFARTEGLFFYAIGERGLASLKAFLDARTKPAVAAGHQPALPRPLRRLQRQTPPGWNAAAVIPTRILQTPFGEEMLWEIWKEVDQEFPREIRSRITRETLKEDAAKLAPILAKYRLDRFILLGGFEPRLLGAAARSRARLRLIW